MSDEDLQQLHSLLDRYADEANAHAHASPVSGERGKAARLATALTSAAIAAAGLRLYRAALPQPKERLGHP
jgi:hypothetical protein